MTQNFFNSPIIQFSLLPENANADEVKCPIAFFKLKKNPEIDGISSEVLITVKELVPEPLARLFNKIFETGNFPTALNIGVTKPVFKSGPIGNFVNYRFISLISTLAKLLEKILK